MAYENIPIAGSLPDIVAIYNIAPWLFDGAILCTIFGLLFRELFKKAKITEEKNESLGGIVGFAIGLILLIGMYRKGWQLVDIWPWLLLALLLIGSVLLWRFLNEMTENHHPWLAALLVIMLMTLVGGLVAGSMPEFIPAEIGWWGGLFIRLAIWLALIGLAAWLIIGGVTQPGGGLLGGLLKSGAGLIARGIAAGAKGIAGGIAAGVKGIAKGAAAGAKGIAKGIAAIAVGIAGQIGKLGTILNNAKKRRAAVKAKLKAIKEAAEKLRKIKEAAHKEIKDIADHIDGVTEEGKLEYMNEIKAYLTNINKAYLELLSHEVMGEFEKCHKEHDNIDTALKQLLTFVKNYLDALKAVGTTITGIKNPTIKAQLEAEFRKHLPEISELYATTIPGAIKRFDEGVNEALKTAKVSRIENVFAEITKTKKELDDLLNEIIGLFTELIRQGALAPPDLKNSIKTKCTEAAGKCTVLNAKIEELIKSSLPYMETAVKALGDACIFVNTLLTDIIAKFNAIKGKIDDLITKTTAQLTSEDTAKMDELKKIVEGKRNLLYNMTDTAWEIVARFGTDIITVNKVNAFPASERDTEHAYTAFKDSLPPTKFSGHFKYMRENGPRVEEACAKLKEVLKQVEDRLRTIGLATTSEEKNQLTHLKNNLTLFLSNEKFITDVLKDFDAYLLKTLLESVRAKEYGVKIILGKALGDIEFIVTLSDLLTWEMAQALPRPRPAIVKPFEFKEDLPKPGRR